jgi:hypothetical protein
MGQVVVQMAFQIDEGISILLMVGQKMGRAA